MSGDEQSADEAQREEAEQSLGEMLKGARAAQELSLEEVAAELRIEERMLRALEEHRFELLGAPVFAKGYLKQYAHRLNLSYDDLLIEYYRLADPRDVTIAPSRVIKLRDERQITFWVIAAVVLALLAVLLFLWWVSQPPATFEPTVTRIDEDTADTLDIEPLPLPVPTAAPVSAAEGEAVAGAEPTASAELPVASEVELTTPQAVAEPAVALPSGPTLQVMLDFRQDSWVEATDNDGRRLFYGLGRAGARSALVGAPPIEVLLGNADGVDVAVAGEPYTVPRAARQGNLARFTLDLSD